MVAILKRTSEEPQARRVFHVVFHKCEYVDEMKPVWKRLNEMQAGCLAGIEKGLKAAAARGQLAPDLDARHAALGLHALLDGLISKWVMDADSRPRQRNAEYLVDLFINGLQRPTRARRRPRARDK